MLSCCWAAWTGVCRILFQVQQFPPPPSILGWIQWSLRSVQTLWRYNFILAYFYQFDPTNCGSDSFREIGRNLDHTVWMLERKNSAQDHVISLIRKRGSYSSSIAVFFSSSSSILHMATTIISVSQMKHRSEVICPESPRRPATKAGFQCRPPETQSSSMSNNLHAPSFLLLFWVVFKVSHLG